jgi:hypothetical protein
MTENTVPVENTENDNLENDISENNLIWKIWYKPKQTLQYVLRYCPDKYLYIIFILAGVSRAIDRASTQSMGDNQSTIFILIIAIIAGGLFGWISYYFYSWLMKVSGKWMDGKATFDEYRTVVAWSLIPTVSSLVLLVPELMIFGDDLFRSEMSDPTVAKGIIMICFGLLEMSLGIWTLVILVKGVSLIQNFGTGKAILNVFMPVFILLIPILLIVLVVKMF